MLSCEMTIGEFEEMRTTSGVSVEKDLIGGNKVEQEKHSLIGPQLYDLGQATYLS